MKQLLILLICLTLVWFAGCNGHRESEELPQDYSKAITDWRAGLKPSTAEADSGEQLTINVIFLECWNYDKAKPSYVCLAIDGKVVFDGKVTNPYAPSLGVVACTDLLDGFALKKGKHVFTVFDVAHGLKVEKEIEIVKDGCWVVISNLSSAQEPIEIEIQDKRPLMR